jgi:hypothetical protein
MPGGYQGHWRISVNLTRKKKGSRQDGRADGGWCSRALGMPRTVTGEQYSWRLEDRADNLWLYNRVNPGTIHTNLSMITHKNDEIMYGSWYCANLVSKIVIRIPENQLQRRVFDYWELILGGKIAGKSTIWPQRESTKHLTNQFSHSSTSPVNNHSDKILIRCDRPRHLQTLAMWSPKTWKPIVKERCWKPILFVSQLQFKH